MGSMQKRIVAMRARSRSTNFLAEQYSRAPAPSIGGIEEILNAISEVPITFVHNRRRYEYAGASGHICRVMPLKPSLIRNSEMVSSSHSGARIATNQVEM